MGRTTDIYYVGNRFEFLDQHTLCCVVTLKDFMNDFCAVGLRYLPRLIPPSTITRYKRHNNVDTMNGQEGRPDHFPVHHKK